MLFIYSANPKKRFFAPLSPFIIHGRACGITCEKMITFVVDMIREYKDIDLRPRNSFGISVRGRRLAEFDDAVDLHGIFSRPDMRGEKWYVLGGGNNILFTRDFDGVLLHPAGHDIAVESETDEKVFVRAQAGTDWDEFVAWTTERGLWGAENLSYIPGTVGAAPVQNIGAYGAEAKDIIESVEMFCPETLNMLTLSREHCAFGYRDSIFKGALRGKVVITSVLFALRRTPCPRLGYGDVERKVAELGEATPENIRRAVTEIRRGKLPDPAVTGNAGSFFKNPVVESGVAAGLRAAYPGMPTYPAAEEGKIKLAAGWLIEQAGWKGGKMGRAGVHPRQALVLVNCGGASGDDVMALARRIQSDVAARFGIEIDTEVNIL